MPMDVPTARSLADIYPEDALDGQRSRWTRLLASFGETYGRQADFVSRSPGRVNIIGEHIDYSLYEVLPMAVTADVLIAVAVRPALPSQAPRVRVANVRPDKFPAREFEIPVHGHIPIDASAHEWTNYLRSGLRGATELLARKNEQKKDEAAFVSVGMDILLDGSVPAGGGLSSSAAFVCAAALAVLRANGEDSIDQTELTEVAIVSERAVGVNSGGMDQAASVFSRRGSALYVSFKPSLSARPVSFPKTDPELTFVIAQSFVAADKHVTAPTCYNLRVVECTLAAAFLHRAFNLQKPLPKDASPLGVSLRGFQDAYFEEKDGEADNTQIALPKFQRQLEQLLAMCEDYLSQDDGYTREQVAEMLGLSVKQLQQRYESTFAVHAERFKLKQRAMHVFGESLRVARFLALLDNAPSTLGSGSDAAVELQRALGALMNETQDSCRDLYECSCPELNELCALARSAGAFGSRLTGAGWGGCSVHLVPKDRIEDVKARWVERYYRKRWPDISPEELDAAIVVSKPGSGSSLLEVVDHVV